MSVEREYLADKKPPSRRAVASAAWFFLHEAAREHGDMERALPLRKSDISMLEASGIDPEANLSIRNQYLLIAQKGLIKVYREIRDGDVLPPLRWARAVPSRSHSEQLARELHYMNRRLIRAGGPAETRHELRVAHHYVFNESGAATHYPAVQPRTEDALVEQYHAFTAHEPSRHPEHTAMNEISQA